MTQHMHRNTAPNIMIISLLAMALAFLAFPVLSASSSPVANQTASSSPAANQTASSGNQVNISPGSSSPSNAKFFEPVVLNVPVGTTVSWKNSDSTLHTVTSGIAESGTSGTLFDSSYLAAGKTFQYTFSKAGTFDYFCELHPFMKGQVMVN